MITASFLSLLKTIYENLSRGDINWALTGSTSFALQGLPFEPKDIDIQTNEKGAYEIELIFIENIIKPVDGQWERTPYLKDIKRFIQVNDMQLPVNLVLVQEIMAIHLGV